MSVYSNYELMQCFFVFSQWSVEKAAEINAHLLDHVHLCPPKMLKARPSTWARPQRYKNMIWMKITALFRTWYKGLLYFSCVKGCGFTLTFFKLKPETHCTIFGCPRQKIGPMKQWWRIRNHGDCFMMPVFCLGQPKIVQSVSDLKDMSKFKVW